MKSRSPRVKGFQRKLRDLEITRRMTRLELRQAQDLQWTVSSYSHGRTPEEVAKLTGMTKTLVKQLNTGDVGYLGDAILWQRRQAEQDKTLPYVPTVRDREAE